jgi:hypothetical protein
LTLQRQTLALGAIGIIDLVTTLVFINHNGAAEANPLMATFLTHGIAVFLTAKLCFLAGPLLVLEWARKSRPVFVARALNVGMIAYVCLYMAGVTRVNAEPDWDHLEFAGPKEVWQQIEARIQVQRRERGMQIGIKRLPWPPPMAAVTTSVAVD